MNSRSAESAWPALWILLSRLFWLIALGAPAHAAETDSWRHWYDDYEGNAYAIQIPLTQDNAGKLKQRLELYRYRLVYLRAGGTDENPAVRIGFFPSENSARDAAGGGRTLFSGQTVVRVSRAEHAAVVSQVLQGTAKSPANGYLVFAVTADPGKPATEAALERAKNHYMDGRYQQALGLYRLLAVVTEKNTAAWAKELAGLCHEKLGNTALAIQTYAELLQDFPDASGRARVEQRMRGLQTAADYGRAALPKSAGSERRFFTRGVIGQYYRTLSRSLNGAQSEEVMSLISTDFDIRANGRWDGHDVQARLNGFSIKDQLEGEDSEFRLKRLFVDYRHEGTGTGITVGRQRDYDSGVFTSFDGVTVSYPLMKDVRLSASAGKPIYFADFYDDLDYAFHSVFLEWDPDGRWRLNGYYTTQKLDEVTDREAVGLRASYAGERLSGSLNADYDTAFSELNNLLFSGSYQLNGDVTVNALYGRQRSPFLTATNIFIGQADLDLELYLTSKENRDALLDDALARTSLNTYYSFSVNKKMGEHARVVIDYYDSRLTEIPSPELLFGPEFATDTPTEFSHQSYGAQVIGENVLFTNDSGSAGLRRTTGTTSNATQLYATERIRIGRLLNIVPKISYAQVTFANGREDQEQIRYSLALAYRPFRNSEFSLEAGNESISMVQNSNAFDSSYIFVGYRVNF